MRTSFILLLLVILTAGCITGYKKTIGFKAKLKTIDTLTIMPPILNLYCINSETGDMVYDTLLMNRIANSITSTYESLLYTKYYIQKLEDTKTKPDIATLSLIKPLLQKLDHSKKLLNGIQMDPKIYNSYSLGESRYLLFTYMEGGYRPKKGVKNQNRKIPLMVVASVLTGYPLTVLGGRYSNCRFYHYLYDKQENLVLYYTKSDKCEENLWEKETSVQLTKTSSKRLYYK